MTVVAVAEVDVRLRNNVSKGANQIKRDLNSVENSAKKTTASVSKTGSAKTNPLIAIAGTFSPRLKKMSKDIGGLSSAMGESSKMAGMMGLAIKGAIAGVAVGVAVGAIKKLYDAMKSLTEFASPREYMQVTQEFNQAVANLKQTVGTWMTPTFMALTQIMTVVVNDLNEMSYSLIRISSSVRNVFGLGEAFSELSSSIESAQAGLASFDKMNVQGSSQYSADLETMMKIKEASKGSNDIWQDTLAVVERLPIPIVQLYRGMFALGKEIWSTIGNIFSGIDWKGIGDGITSTFTSIFDGIKNALKGVVNFWISAINTVVNGYNATIGSLRIDNDLLNIHFGFPQLGQLPMLANGGVVNANSPMPVIVGDNRSQKEAIAPIDTLKQYIREAVNSSSSNATIPVSIELDGRTLARTTYQYTSSESRRRYDSLNGLIR